MPSTFGYLSVPEWTHFSVCVIAFIVNSFVLIVIWKDPKKCLRTRSAMLITSLIISDLFAAVVNIARPAFETLLVDDKHARDIQHVIIVIALFDALLISFVTIFLTSMEHLLAITQPIKFKILVTKKLVALIIVSNWIACTILATVLYHLPGANIIFRGITVCSVLLVIALIPTIYARAFFSLRQQSKALKAEDNFSRNSNKQRRISQQRHFLLTSAVLVSAYVVTSAPFTIYNYLKISENSSYNFHKDRDSLGFMLWTVLHLNLCLDPFLYCLRIPQYRKSCAALRCKV
jgi:hypothetical protein